MIGNCMVRLEKEREKKIRILDFLVIEMHTNWDCDGECWSIVSMVTDSVQ